MSKFAKSPNDEPDPTKYLKTNEENRVISKEIHQEAYYEINRSIPATVSRIKGLRSFNNWVKSVILQEYTRQGFTVLDLCCGKGGDLGKFAKQKISFYVGIDMSKKNLIEAKDRFKSHNCGFDGILIGGDITDPEITINQIVSQEFNLEYDLVSCQFALNYLWKSESTIRRFLENVTNNLKPGAVFVGTIPDSKVLVKKLRSISKNFTFGNDYYSVKFKTDKFPRENGEFGIEYGFYLEDSIGQAIFRPEGTEINYVPEYLIGINKLKELASEYGLNLIYTRNFHDFYVEYKEKYFGLLRKYLNDAKIDEMQWDAAYLYMVFVFKKNGVFVPPPKNSHSLNPEIKIKYMRDIDD